MSKFFRILFCILGCVSAASTVVVGALTNLIYCLIPVGATVVFAALMLLFKNEPWKKKPEAPKPDFMNTKEENARINREKDIR